MNGWLTDWMEPLDSASEPSCEPSSEPDASEKTSSSSGRARTRRLRRSEIAILLLLSLENPAEEEELSKRKILPPGAVRAIRTD